MVRSRMSHKQREAKSQSNSHTCLKFNVTNLVVFVFIGKARYSCFFAGLS